MGIWYGIDGRLPTKTPVTPKKGSKRYREKRIIKCKKIQIVIGSKNDSQKFEL